MKTNITRIKLSTCDCQFEMTFQIDTDFYHEEISKVINVCDKHVNPNPFESARIALLENRLTNNPNWEDPEPETITDEF